MSFKFPTDWFGGGRETPCGAGSTKSNMANVIRELPKILTKLEVSRVIEIGCGDLNFARHAVLPAKVEYVGYDIKRRDTWKKYSNLELIETDATQVTGFEADLVICRDFFIHLPNDMVLGILDKISADWLLATTYDSTDNSTRKKEPSAGFSGINMMAPPFSLGTPNHKIKEYVDGKYLGLWRL